MFWSVSSQVLQGASMLRGSLLFFFPSAQLVELPLSSAALGKIGPAGAIPVTRTIFSWQKDSATFWNAAGGISVRSYPCLVVHSSRTPSLESPSDRLEAEPIHSYHAEQECSIMANCVHAAIWPTSYAREVPRMSELSAASLTTNRTISLPDRSSGLKTSAACQDCHCLRSKNLCLAWEQDRHEL